MASLGEHIDTTPEEKTAIIITNVVHMLTNRKLLLKQDLDKNIKKYLKYTDPKYNFLIPVKLENNQTYYVQLFNHKVTTINKIPEILDFLSKYSNEHKIVLVDHFNNKAYSQFTKESDNIEVFCKKDLMINILDVDLQPKFEVLTKEERDAYMHAYNIPNKNHSIMKSTDPVARHLNMQVGDIVRIISASNGLNVKYRFVKYTVMDVNDWN